VLVIVPGIGEPRAGYGYAYRELADRLGSRTEIVRVDPPSPDGPPWRLGVEEWATAVAGAALVDGRRCLVVARGVMARLAARSVREAEHVLCVNPPLAVEPSDAAARRAAVLGSLGADPRLYPPGEPTSRLEAAARGLVEDLAGPDPGPSSVRITDHRTAGWRALESGRSDGAPGSDLVGERRAEKRALIRRVEGLLGNR
jgi:hypothetical protein